MSCSTPTQHVRDDGDKSVTQDDDDKPDERAGKNTASTSLMLRDTGLPEQARNCEHQSCERDAKTDCKALKVMCEFNQLGDRRWNLSWTERLVLNHFSRGLECFYGWFSSGTSKLVAELHRFSHQMIKWVEI